MGPAQPAHHCRCRGPSLGSGHATSQLCTRSIPAWDTQSLLSSSSGPMGPLNPSHPGTLKPLGGLLRESWSVPTECECPPWTVAPQGQVAPPWHSHCTPSLGTGRDRPREGRRDTRTVFTAGPVMGKQPSNADRGFWGPHRQRHGTPAASKRNLIFQIAFQLKGLRSSLQTSRGGPRHCF